MTTRTIKFREDELPKKYVINGWLLTIFPNSFKQQGYVKRKVEGHPNSDSRGYVLEHRLVMEMAMGQPLPKNAVIHHKNGVRDDNRFENLEYMVEQERHAKHHAKDLRRNENGQYVAKDPIFGEIKFRLLNKNTGLNEIHTLGKLIATTYRNSQFEFRGRYTGLLDKNKKEIYESDWLACANGSMGVIVYIEKDMAFKIDTSSKYDTEGAWIHPIEGFDRATLEVIGNIYESPKLLK